MITYRRDKVDLYTDSDRERLGLDSKVDSEQLSRCLDDERRSSSSSSSSSSEDSAGGSSKRNSGSLRKSGNRSPNPFKQSSMLKYINENALQQGDLSLRQPRKYDLFGSCRNQKEFNDMLK